jgi:hypothetical protein
MFASTLVLAACSASEPSNLPPPPVVAQDAPPPPPVLLPREVVEAASVFETYVQRASTIEPKFTSGETVAISLRAGETYEADQFQRGEAAYGAIVALQDPTFVSNLRIYAYDAPSRTQIVNSVLIDPEYITHFKGADSAAGRQQLPALFGQGRHHQAWSKAEVQGREGRLALAKSLSSEQQQAVREDALRLSQAVNGVQPLGMAAPTAPGPYTPLVARALSVAAMAAMGEGGEEYSGQIRTLLSDVVQGNCLREAKLNLYQCLAVSRPHYEDVFCLGQHAVADTGQCVLSGALVSVPPPAVVEAAPVPEIKNASVKKPAVRHKKKVADPS